MTHLQLGNPLSNEHIVATLQGVVDGEEVPKALELIPMNLLSDYFLTPPVPKMLHLIVKCEYQSSTQVTRIYISLICHHASAKLVTLFQ